MNSLGIQERPLKQFSTDCLKGKKVLVVDDQPDARLLLQRIFTHRGADVCTAASVSEALEVIPAFAPHILVSDIAMPVQSGYDLIRALRHSADDIKNIPAIAVSGHAGYDDKERSIAEGFQTLMMKPLNFPRLIALVVQLLEGASSTA